MDYAIIHTCIYIITNYCWIQILRNNVLSNIEVPDSSNVTRNIVNWQNVWFCNPRSSTTTLSSIHILPTISFRSLSTCFLVSPTVLSVAPGPATERAWSMEHFTLGKYFLLIVLMLISNVVFVLFFVFRVFSQRGPDWWKQISWYISSHVKMYIRIKRIGNWVGILYLWTIYICIFVYKTSIIHVHSHCMCVCMRDKIVYWNVLRTPS